MYAYVVNLGRFVLHRSLGADFHWDRELDWAPVDIGTARALINSGALGRLDDDRHRDFLAQLEAETDQRSVAEALGVVDESPDIV